MTPQRWTKRLIVCGISTPVIWGMEILAALGGGFALTPQLVLRLLVVSAATSIVIAGLWPEASHD
jgi:hypothetical protein